MGVAETPLSRCRHVAFVYAEARRALNLGAHRSDSSRRSWSSWQKGAQSDDGDRAVGADDAEEAAFLSALLFRAGLRASDYRPQSLRRRLPACLRALRAESPAHARWLVRRSPQLVPVAIDALLLG